MTDTRFNELVNLYLDREISPRDLQVLRKELTDQERKQKFESLRRIHNAERQALALICGNPQRELRRDSLTQRATRAINEACIKFEERRKGLVLLCQFSAATAAIAVTVGLLYRDSVEALEVEVSPEADMTGTPPIDVREHLLAQLNSPNSNSRLIIDQSGRPLALVSYRDQGEVQIQSLQTVPESNIFRLGRALEAARPQLPNPAELLENRSPTIPVRQFPGTATPVVLVEESQGAGAVIGYAY
ncbi:hypothetical protein [Cerasicoccus arenae]|uniref:Uncharacterized protein n=1 Tax=Cerasicoccus arenae TaxID=424488 RepID=A0A8J3GEI0_9BACT|nr:hypothetical protein [Cerasicoccus arenae]MBK1856695.1 hypothetical protein [Cerasicoccus arenae]GHB98968.1 hypothetical protein GCM10007047_13760 [Cerasicoccus arenae]